MMISLVKRLNLWHLLSFLTAVSCGIGLIDGSLVYLVKSLNISSSGVQLSPQVAVLFLLRFIFLGAGTYLSSLILFSVQLRLDNAVKEQMSSLNSSEVLHYATNISANVVFVAFVAISTLVADITLVVVLVITVSYPYPFESMFFLFSLSIIAVPPIAYFQFRSKRFASRKAIAEHRKIDFVVKFQREYDGIKFLGRNLDAEALYDGYMANWSRATANLFFVGRFQRYAIEMTIMTSGIVALAGIHHFTKSVEPLFLVLISIVGAKMLPLTFRLGKGFMVIGNTKPYITYLLQLLDQRQPSKYHSSSEIELFLMNLRKGKLNLIIGPSGSGKSTFLLEVCRHLESRGVKFGYASQFSRSFSNDLILDASIYGLRPDELISACCDLGVERRPASESFSGGEEKRISVARIIAQDNLGYIIFDEPDSGLSKEDADRLWSLLEKRADEVVVLCVSHGNYDGAYVNHVSF